MGSLEERQEYTPDGQELPPWQEYRLVTTTKQGVPVITGEIVQIVQTYYGPSIPLGEGWAYGGSTSPALVPSLPTGTPTSAAPTSLIGSSLPPTITSSTVTSAPAISSIPSSPPSSSDPCPSPTYPSSTFASTPSPTSTSTGTFGILSTPVSSRLFSILLPSLVGALLLCLIITTCILCYRRKSEYRRARVADPDRLSVRGSAARSGGVSTVTTTDTTPDSAALTSGSAGAGAKDGRLPTPDQISDESFGDNPIPDSVTLGPAGGRGRAMRSESGMYRSIDKAPFLSHSDEKGRGLAGEGIAEVGRGGKRQASHTWPGKARGAGNVKPHEKAGGTIGDGDVTESHNLSSAAPTATPDRRHLFSKISSSLGLGIGAPPARSQTVSGRYFSPGTAERYIGTSPGSRVPSWAMIADIGESVRRHISGSVVGRAMGSSTGNPGPSRAYTYGYEGVAGPGILKKERQSQDEKDQVVDGGHQHGRGDGQGVWKVNASGDTVGYHGIPGDDDHHSREELTSLADLSPDAKHKQKFTSNNHIENARPIADTSAPKGMRDSFVGTPSIIDNIPNGQVDEHVETTPQSAAVSVPMSHTPRSLAMSMGESDLFYRKPLDRERERPTHQHAQAAANASVSSFARELFRHRQRPSASTLASGAVSAAQSRMVGEGGSASSRGSAHARLIFMRDARAGAGSGSVASRGTRGTSSSGTTSSSARSNSGLGGRGGMMTPWTRREGISPADDFGTPLRELASLADRYEHEYHFDLGEEHGSPGGMERGDRDGCERDGGAAAQTNAALPLGRDDELPVYTPERRVAPPAVPTDDEAYTDHGQQSYKPPYRPQTHGQYDARADLLPAGIVSAHTSGMPGTDTLNGLGPYGPSQAASDDSWAVIKPRPRSHAEPATASAQYAAGEGTVVPESDKSNIARWRDYTHAAMGPASLADADATAGANGVSAFNVHEEHGGREGRGDHSSSSGSGSRLDFPLPPLGHEKVDDRERGSVTIASEYHSTRSRASSAASLPSLPNKGHGRTRSLSLRGWPTAGIPSEHPPMPMPVPARPIHKRAASSARQQGALLRLSHLESPHTVGKHSELEDLTGTGTSTPIATANQHGGPTSDPQEQGQEAGQKHSDVLGSVKRVLNLSGLFRSRAASGSGPFASSIVDLPSSPSSPTPHGPVSVRAVSQAHDKFFVSESSLDPLADVSLAGPLSAKGGIGWGTASNKRAAISLAPSPTTPMHDRAHSSPNSYPDSGQHQLKNRRGSREEQLKVEAQRQEVVQQHAGAERRVSIADIAVSGQVRRGALMHSQVGQVGGRLVGSDDPRQGEDDDGEGQGQGQGGAGEGWTEFGQLLQPEQPSSHILPPVSRHSLIGSIKASDSSPSAYSGELTPDALQIEQFGLLGSADAALPRVNSGTATEGSRVSTVAEVGESHAVRASTATIIRPSSLLPTPLITPMLSSSPRFSPAQVASSSRLSHTSLLGSPVAGNGSWTHLAKLHAVQRGDVADVE